MSNLNPLGSGNYNSRHPPEAATIKLNRKPTIPRAFVIHPRLKYTVYCIIEQFGHEEQQAIGYFYYEDNASIKDIARITELTENRVLGAICLYAERLNARLEFCKRVLPYDANDVLQITDILFHDVWGERSNET